MYNRLVQATQINAKEPFPCSILEYNKTQMHLAEKWFYKTIEKQERGKINIAAHSDKFMTVEARLWAQLRLSPLQRA